MAKGGTYQQLFTTSFTELKDKPRKDGVPDAGQFSITGKFLGRKVYYRGTFKERSGSVFTIDWDKRSGKPLRAVLDAFVNNLLRLNMH